MKVLRRFVLGGLAAGLAVSAGAAAEPPKGLTNWDMTGTVGPYPIGLNATVRDYRMVADSYYFYGSRLTNIPLTVSQQGDTLVLTEAGGGVFRLHLVGDSGGEPLSFYTSTGLAGTWTGGGKTLPVTLSFGTSRDGGLPSRRYGDVTSQSDAQFEAMVRRLVKAAVSGDKATAAAAVSYPLRINGSKSRTIRNKAELTAQWASIFTPKVIAEFRTAMPHDMFVRNGMAMLGNGVAWFNAKGLAALNLP